MKIKKDIIEVFRGTQMEAEFVRVLLKDHEIDSFIKDGFMGTIAPFHAAPGGAGAVKVVVSSADVEQAMSVIDTYHQHRQSDS